MRTIIVSAMSILICCSNIPLKPNSNPYPVHYDYLNEISKSRLNLNGNVKCVIGSTYKYMYSIEGFLVANITPPESTVAWYDDLGNPTFEKTFRNGTLIDSIRTICDFASQKGTTVVFDLVSKYVDTIVYFFNSSGYVTKIHYFDPSQIDWGFEYTGTKISVLYYYQNYQNQVLISRTETMKYNAAFDSMIYSTLDNKSILTESELKLFDSKGNVILDSCIFPSSQPPSPASHFEYQYDSNDNWVTSIENKTDTTRRIIEYY